MRSWASSSRVRVNMPAPPLPHREASCSSSSAWSKQVAYCFCSISASGDVWRCWWKDQTKWMNTNQVAPESSPEVLWTDLVDVHRSSPALPTDRNPPLTIANAWFPHGTSTSGLQRLHLQVQVPYPLRKGCWLWKQTSLVSTKLFSIQCQRPTAVSQESSRCMGCDGLCDQPKNK